MAKIAILRKDTTKKASSRVSDTADDEIRQLAYQFYVERGYQDGFDREDWQRAEQIVKARRAS